MGESRSFQDIARSISPESMNTDLSEIIRFCPWMNKILSLIGEKMSIQDRLIRSTKDSWIKSCQDRKNLSQIGGYRSRVDVGPSIPDVYHSLEGE